MHPVSNYINEDDEKLHLQQENENKMQIVALKCVGECGEDDGKLYFCNQCDSEIVYCDECGPFLHRKKNHRWKESSIVIPNIDMDKYKFGERLIIDHIGEEKYRRIAPLYHAVTSQTQTISSVFQQSNMLFDALPKQIAAVEKAKELGDYSKKVLAASKTACRLAFESKGKEKECVSAMNKYVSATNKCVSATKYAQHLWETDNAKIRPSPFNWLYKWMYGNELSEAQKNYYKAKKLSEAATKLSAAAIKASETATKASKDASEIAHKASGYVEECVALTKKKLVESQQATEAVHKATSINQSIKCGGCWAVGFIVIEMAWNGYKLGCDEITPNEFRRLTAKSICRNGISMGVNIIGTQIGVGAVSALTLKNVFNSNKYAAICGIGVGIIAGVIANAYIGKRFDAFFEARWPSEEKAQRQKIIDEALKYFHFAMNETEDSKKFNAKIVQKKYRKYALESHPDRNQGDILKWQELSVYYGILMGLLDANKKSEIPTQNAVDQ